MIQPSEQPSERQSEQIPQQPSYPVQPPQSQGYSLPQPPYPMPSLPQPEAYAFPDAPMQPPQPQAYSLPQSPVQPSQPQAYQPYSMPSGQPQAYALPQQPPYPMPSLQQQPYPGQPAVMVQNYYQAPAPVSVTVNVSQSGPSFLMRVLWYIFIGWWLGLFWLNVGYFFCITIILLPVGLVMLNRLPWVLTLRPNSQQTTVAVSNGAVNINIGGPQQQSFLIRALYFVFIGWWLGYLWAIVGLLLCYSIFLMPLGLMMLNRLPGVLTLRKN